MIEGSLRLLGRAFVAVGVSNLVLGSAAFAISGCLVKVNRFRHLFVVAGVAWLGTLLYVVFGVTTPEGYPIFSSDHHLV